MNEINDYKYLILLLNWFLVLAFSMLNCHFSKWVKQTAKTANMPSA